MLDPTSPPRILLVETNDGLRGDLASALVRTGFAVEAMEQAPTRAALPAGHPLACRVLDLKAPGVAAWLAGDDEIESPTILLSADPEAAAAARERIGPNAEILHKPFRLADLEARILARIGGDGSERERFEDPILATRNPVLRRVIGRAKRLARRSTPISLVGELGSGRLALARQIHGWSARAAEPFVVLDRPQLDGLGGARVGEVIGETIVRVGNGTLVVDDPAEQSDAAQESLVAALRGGGSSGPRWLAVARCSLEESVASGALEVELQYRLEATALHVPSFRERPEDHERLCASIARRVARELGQSTPALDAGLIEPLARDGFPGNRLGLESRLRSALIRSEGDGEMLRAMASSDSTATEASSAAIASLDLKTLERDTIVRALAHWGGNRTRASESLGISVRTLRNKIRDYGLR